ncbi:peptidase M14, partial [Pseudomonadota bacterium]
MRLTAGLALLMIVTSLSAKTAQEYLPADADLDPAIPTPESVLGWDVGDWHVGHDRLVQYMQTLAAASPRVSIKVIGQTHEQRPLLQLAITSENNQQQLDSLRQTHLDSGGPLV